MSNLIDAMQSALDDLTKPDYKINLMTSPLRDEMEIRVYNINTHHCRIYRYAMSYFVNNSSYLTFQYLKNQLQTHDDCILDANPYIANFNHLMEQILYSSYNYGLLY